jgi:hypothetical protein
MKNFSETKNVNIRDTICALIANKSRLPVSDFSFFLFSFSLFTGLQ